MNGVLFYNMHCVLNSRCGLKCHTVVASPSYLTMSDWKMFSISFHFHWSFTIQPSGGRCVCECAHVCIAVRFQQVLTSTRRWLFIVFFVVFTWNSFKFQCLFQMLYVIQPIDSHAYTQPHHPYHPQHQYNGTSEWRNISVTWIFTTTNEFIIKFSSTIIKWICISKFNKSM